MLGTESGLTKHWLGMNRQKATPPISLTENGGLSPEAEPERPISGDWRCNIAPSVSLQGCRPLGETPLVFQCVGPGFHQQWSPRPEGAERQTVG